jgi:hypothetical protein
LQREVGISTVRFELDEFERVSAGTGITLLRVAGRWHSTDGLELEPPTLVVDDGNGAHRLQPLPGSDDGVPAVGPDAPLWRAAFSAPEHLLEGDGKSFTLDAGTVVVELPHPSDRLRERQAVAVADAEARPSGLGRALDAARIRGGAPTEAEQRIRALEAEQAELAAEVERLRAELAARNGGVVGRPRIGEPPASLTPPEWVMALALLVFGAVVVLVLVLLAS